MAACQNPEYINTANVDYFGFSTTFNPYLKTVTFVISGYTEFKAGGQANISEINFEVIDPQENTYTATIDPSASETQVTISNLVGGLLYFGTYHIKGTLVEADASTYDIEFDVEVCDSDLLKSNNYIVGCVSAEANCVTAKLTITDQNSYIYNKMDAEFVEYDNKMWLPDDPDGSLEEFNFTYLPYVKSLSGFYTGNYQISVTAVATYALKCASFLEITYKGNLTKTIDCTASLCELNCCWAESNQIAAGAGQKAGQMAEKVAEATPYYLEAVGNYLCGKNAEKAIAKVNDILGCSCTCRQYIIQPAPITIGNSNIFGECGTTVTRDDNGDIQIHSFVYTLAKGDPTDMGYSITTTQINECTKRTVFAFDYNVLQQNILNAIANNAQYILNWQEVLGIKNCPCEDVEIENGSELVTLNTQSSDFYTLEDTYFVKNDIITGVEYDDSTGITGGVIDYVKYTDQIIQQAGTTIAGQNITLPCGVCGESIAGLSGYKLLTEAFSTCGCIEKRECDLDTPYVDYSERYGSAYRFNPQIEEPCYTTYTEIIDGNPYTMYKIFYGDTQANASWSAVRVAIIKVSNVGVISLHETRTIIGANFGDINTPTTNNTWGDQVALNRPSSINLDFDEIVNGEPVLYFTTFGGYIIRAVRERCNECDERANWKVYILADTSESLYGIKKFLVDSNGNRTFIYYNNSQSKLYAFTYDNVGSKNSAANWSSADIGIACIGTGSNFNVELGKNYIFVLNDGSITLSVYGGANTISAITNPANYLQFTVCGNLSATATSYIDSTGDTATVWQPTWIQKIVVGGQDRYYFGNTDSDITNNYIKLSYVRWFRFITSDPADPANFDFHTEIVVNNNSILDDGTWNTGVSSNVNGAAQGQFVIGGTESKTISMFIYGIKIFDYTNHVVTLLSGQGSAIGNLETGLFMDSQWSYELGECEGGGSGSGE